MPGFAEIGFHMIFDVKMDGLFTRKAQFVANGNETEDLPKWDSYVSVISRETVRIALLYAALNDLDVAEGNWDKAVNPPARQAKLIECAQKRRLAQDHTHRVYDRDGMTRLQRDDSLKRLEAIVRNYVGDELICEIKLILKKEDVPDVELGKSGLLGRTTWLKSKPLPEDADDFRWRLHGAT